METAKVFMNGRSQAVRLPKAFRFDGNEVFIKNTAQGVLLVPKEQSIWDVWEQNMQKYDNEPFMEQREQPDNQQHRDGLDELFD
jgi:antitoxin VapB